MSGVRQVAADEGFRFDVPGCYRTQAFQALLARHPEALQLYARHVEAQAHEPAYLQRVRRLVPRLVRWLGAEVAADGRRGSACRPARC